MSYTIRDAILADAEPVALLITELGYPTAPEAMGERLVAILADPSHATLVAEVEGRVMGVAGVVLNRYYEKDGLYARLAVLSVASGSRGLGIGARLVEAVEAWALGQGAREVIVNSGLQRADAHRFYERCGYSRTGLRLVKQIGGGGPR